MGEKVWRPKRDPKPGRGGGCAVCGKARGWNVIAHGDPFCSTECARKWHGVEIKKDKPPDPPLAAA